MRKIIGILGLITITALLVATGRSAEDKDKSDPVALQGTWKGHEIGEAANNACFLIVSGKKMEYKGTDTNDWAKGTFAIKEGASPQQVDITITASPAPEAVGKICHIIYEIKDGTLKLAGNAPGDTNLPTSFDAPDARKFALKKE